MRAEHISNDDELEFNKRIETLTDREIQEKQAYYLKVMKNDVKSIRDNVLFIFWVTLISAGMALIATLLAIN